MRIWLLLIIIFLLFIDSAICGAEEINWDRLVSAIIQIESGGDPNAISETRAIGLMQISSIVLLEYNQFI